MEPDAFAKRLIALAGGKARAREMFGADLRAINQTWKRDTGLIGRLLRAHLTVEHFMTGCLSRMNTNLGDLEAARLTFTQKLALLDSKDITLAEIIPGIRRLNELRNALAHRLTGPLQPSDVEPLLAVAIFRALREALAAPGKPHMEPIKIVEDFALFSANILQHKGSHIEKLMRQVLADDAKENASEAGLNNYKKHDQIDIIGNKESDDVSH